ncbi:MAG: hypothetical protein AAFU85_34155, partial [Planctomycetota bacterium]
GSGLVDRIAATLTEKRRGTATQWLDPFIDACLQPFPSERCADSGELMILLDQALLDSATPNQRHRD